MKKALIIFGPPGSGKGTQANLLAAKLGLIHFDTGKYLEQILHDPANKNNKTIQKEKINWNTGKLCTPSWILKIVRKRVIEFSKAGLGLVFSGSPRTAFEAFGDRKNESLVETLEKSYGRNNVIFILLKIDPRDSIKRNNVRLVCSSCGMQVLAKACRGKECPLCAAPLRKRLLDSPEINKTRIQEYEKRTALIISGLQERNYKLHVIDGRPAPFKVFSNIISKISKYLHDKNARGN